MDTHSRLICYDILDLGKQLQPIGMLVVLDSILNRITQNRAKGRNTFIFIDEIYLLFQHEYSANFLFTLWKRVRKYGAYCTGITQNVDDLLQSHTAKMCIRDRKEAIRSQLSDLSKRLSVIRKEVRLCEGIEARNAALKEKLSTIRADEEQQRKELMTNEHRRRSGRANRPNELGGI